jgi:hypothetical protein
MKILMIQQKLNIEQDSGGLGEACRRRGGIKGWLQAILLGHVSTRH